MRKTHTQLTSLLLMMVMGIITAVAAEFPTDGSPITTGTVYEVKAFVDYKATLTPTSSGKLIQQGTPDIRIEGLDNSYTFIGYGQYGQEYSYQVTAGKTYQVSGWPMDNGYVCFVMEAEVGVKLNSVIPEAGSILPPNVNNTGDVLLQFNTSVEFTTAYLQAGDNLIEVTNNSFNTNTIALNIKDAMNSMFANGTLNPDGGDPIKIVVEGLSSESGVLYNGDGKLTIEYISSPKLADLVSTNIPNVIKSYYPEGDPEGIWTFVFDENLMDDAALEISCGNVESEGSFYHEIIPAKVDGNTLTFNLTDKKRELEDYLMAQGSNYVAVKVYNVRSTNGYYANGNGEGNVGSYSYSLGYNYIQPQAVVCEFTPASGTSLKGVESIEIWYNNADLILFDGVKFNYSTGDGFANAIVLKEDLDMTLDNNEMTINVKIPEEVKGHDQITVSLYNQQALDGNNYRIEAQYDMFIIELLSPIKDGQKIKSTGTEDFVFSINQTNLYFYLRYDFYTSPEEWVYGTELTKQENGTWTAYNGDFVCEEGTEPYMIVSAYYTQNDWEYGQPAAETRKFTFVGASAPFTYSDTKFVSIDPEGNSVITPEPDFHFTVTFDGLAHIDADKSGIMMGFGMGVEPFAKLEPIYGEEEYTEGYAPVWYIYPEEITLASAESIDISIFANDPAGKVIEGNMGGNEFDYLQFSYGIANGANYVDVTVIPADLSILEQLDQMTFTYDGLDVSLNYSYTGDVNPRIFDANFNVVKEFTQDDFKLVEKADSTYELQLTFEPIVEKGTYYVSVPENYLLVGDQFNVHGNNLVFVTYTVEPTSGISSAISSQNADVKVYNLQGIQIDNSNLRPGLYIIGNKKVYIK